MAAVMSDRSLLDLPATTSISSAASASTSTGGASSSASTASSSTSLSLCSSRGSLVDSPGSGSGAADTEPEIETESLTQTAFKQQLNLNAPSGTQQQRPTKPSDDADFESPRGSGSGNLSDSDLDDVDVDSDLDDDSVNVNVIDSASNPPRKRKTNSNASNASVSSPKLDATQSQPLNLHHPSASTISTRNNSDANSSPSSPDLDATTTIGTGAATRTTAGAAAVTALSSAQPQPQPHTNEIPNTQHTVNPTATSNVTINAAAVISTATERANASVVASQTAYSQTQLQMHNAVLGIDDVLSALSSPRVEDSTANIRDHHRKKSAFVIFTDELNAALQETDNTPSSESSTQSASVTRSESAADVLVHHQQHHSNSHSHSQQHQQHHERNVSNSLPDAISHSASSSKRTVSMQQEAQHTVEQQKNSPVSAAVADDSDSMVAIAPRLSVPPPLPPLPDFPAFSPHSQSFSEPSTVITPPPLPQRPTHFRSRTASASAMKLAKGGMMNGVNRNSFTSADRSPLFAGLGGLGGLGGLTTVREVALSQSDDGSGESRSPSPSSNTGSNQRRMQSQSISMTSGFREGNISVLSATAISTGTHGNTALAAVNVAATFTATTAASLAVGIGDALSMERPRGASAVPSTTQAAVGAIRGQSRVSFINTSPQVLAGSGAALPSPLTPNSAGLVSSASFSVSPFTGRTKKASEVLAGSLASSILGPGLGERRTCADDKCKNFVVRGEYCLRHQWKSPQLLHKFGMNSPRLSFAVAADSRQLKVINELAATERSYLEGLRVLYRVFYCRLQALNLHFPARSLVSTEDLTMVFGNVEDIFRVSEMMMHDLDELQATRNDGLMLAQIGATLLHFASSFRVYQQYLENYDDASKRLVQLRKDSAELNFFIKWQEKCEANLSIDSFLILPVQRLPRYLLLLTELIKYSEDKDNEINSDAISDMKSALEKIKRIANAINESLHKKEAYLKLCRLQALFEKDERYFELAHPNRTLIRQGKLQKRFSQLSRQLAKKKEYCFFLFNDLLIYAAFSQKTFTKEVTFKVKHVLNVLGLLVEKSGGPKGLECDLIIHATRATTDAKGRGSGSGKKSKVSINVVAANTSQRDEWFAALSGAAARLAAEARELRVERFDGGDQSTRSSKAKQIIGAAQ